MGPYESCIDADTELKIEDVGRGDPKDGDAFAVSILRRGQKSGLVIGRSSEDFVVHASGAEIELQISTCAFGAGVKLL